MDINLLITFIASFVTVLFVTPLIIKLAHKIGATDKPNKRKVHQKIMPRLGGLAIFIGVIVGYMVSGLYDERIYGIIVGAIIIVIIGVLDDMYELKARTKLLGQFLVAGVVVYTGLKIEFLTIPFVVERFDLGWMAIPITIIWIIGITNAINLIDGLDGLAAGISSIAIATLAVMAGIAGKELILTLCLVILASTIGFLFFNFHPAKIFMGDTGALFLGYCIAVLSLLGLYKSVTLFSFLIPIIILGVPVFDTAFAIIRRILNKQPISAPDKSHLHHRLLAKGISHRNTVLLIYAFGIFFSICAVLLTTATFFGAILIFAALIVITQFIAELVGIINAKYKPVMDFYKKVTGKN
ncbi:glycosyltransferase family 4 protein [Sutcliffiella horikoshii]|uniref:glycosyltransferase family 4 protein n=1 Tax=Sutcliffiella horikoshii TaxID=79883 RepID=UPI001CFD7A04|nr:MraY family glycosyltransferase [Sutcliffiella horikoshii]